MIYFYNCRTNPLYTDIPGGLGDLEAGSLSSGYFSTFRREGKVGEGVQFRSVQRIIETKLIKISESKSDDDTEDDSTKQSFDTVHEFHPHLPDIDLVTSRNIIISKKVSATTNSVDQNCNWYLLRKFGMDEEEARFSTYRPTMHRKNIFSDAHIEGEHI